jgi:uncharacterized membrane protein
MNPVLLTRLLILLPIAFISLLLPWFAQVRAGVLFGVTVPLDFVQSAEARAAIHRFRVNVIALIVIVLSCAAAILWLAPPRSIFLSLVAIVPLPLELVATFVLWHRGANTIRGHAAVVSLERHVDLRAESTRGPLLFSALSLLPLLATALWLKAHWDQMPARWPTHWGVSGQPNGWGTHTFLGVFSPLLIGAATIVLLIGVAFFIANASGPQRSQRRRSLTPLAALAWLMSAMFSLVSALPLMHLTSTNFMLIVASYLLVVFAVAFWLIWRSGFAPHATGAEPYDSTPDSKWHGGLIYFNPADAAVIVPKRFGIGWTLNFARPAAWVYLAAILLFGFFLKVLLK